MARIRTIKPEFWTDSVIVKLPLLARLLYIGLWNFADDEGRFADEPDRIHLQVLPAESGADIVALLDLLEASGRLELNDGPGGRFWSIPRFASHQKVDHPAKSRFGDSARKRAIPTAARRAVAQKYGCKPGETIQACCFYCGNPGAIYWWKKPDGTPSSWVSFGLELDHATPELQGGKAEVTNLVLACRECNRSKGFADFEQFIATLREGSRVLAPEGKGKEGNGMEGKGGGVEAPAPQKQPPPVPLAVPLPALPDDRAASGPAYFAWVQNERYRAGFVVEKPPPVSELGRWFSEIMGELNGDVDRVDATYKAFAAKPYWRERNCPFRGFISEWRSFTPRKAAAR